MTGADMSFVNGGDLRAPMESGDVTAEISGQILIDFLEMAVMNYPEEYAEVKPNISFTDGVITETPDNNKNNEQDDRTGMRVGELIGLRWCDIDLDEGLIHVNHTLIYYNKGGGQELQLRNQYT